MRCFRIATALSDSRERQYTVGYIPAQMRGKHLEKAMGINSRHIVCDICGAAVLTDLFGNHQHQHTHPKVLRRAFGDDKN